MKHVLLGLVCTPSIGWTTIKKIVESPYKLSAEILNWTSTDFQKAFPFLTRTQLKHLQVPLSERVDRQLEKLMEHETSFISFGDPQYPQQLAESSQAPWVLFYKGNSALLHAPSIAIVGSRKATQYGFKVTEHFSHALVQAGYTIVSGLAQGIDTYSHRAVLKHGGETIAVLGNSFDHVYPPHNRKLQDQIARQGCLVSELPFSTPPRPSHFPLRNRIIAGLSQGTLVIEAQQQSGSLLTAYLALEYGREVFAVPGDIFEAYSTGTNQLIQKQGAKLVLNAEDILEELKCFNSFQLQGDQGLGTLKQNEGLGTLSQNECSLNVQHAPLTGVDDEIQSVYLALSQHRLTVEELSQITQLSVAQVQYSLLELELLDRVEVYSGRYFSLK